MCEFSEPHQRHFQTFLLITTTYISCSDRGGSVKFPVTNNIVIVFHYSTFNCGQWLQKEEDSHNKMGRHHHRHHDHREHHHHDHHHHRRRRHKINFEDVESINLVLGTSSSMPTQEQEEQHHHEHHQHQDHHDSGAMSLDRIGKR